MSQLSDTDRFRSMTHETFTWGGPSSYDEALRLVTGLIRWGFGVLNNLILIRLFLRMMASNPQNLFAMFIYSTTDPFLEAFKNLVATPVLNGMVIELYDLIAIAVYGLLGWIIIRFLQILFAHAK